MIKPIRSRSALEAQDQLTADILVRWFGENCWLMFKDGEIPSILSEGFQIRDKNATAKPSDVDALSLAYQNQDPVPAIVITLPGSAGSPPLIVDGRTRLEGRIKACAVMDWPSTIRQFVINIDPDKADSVTRGRLMLCGMSLNQTHGVKMTLRNVSDVLQIAMPGEDSMSSATLAAMLHISPSTVERVRQMRRAEKRAADLDIPLEYDGRVLSTSALCMFGQKDKVISNKIFKEIVTLVLRARLSTNEMKILFSEVQADYDDAGRMGTIARWKAECKDRMEGRAGRPTNARRLQLLLGQLDRIDLDAMVERDNPALFGVNLARLEAGRAKLDEAIKKQLAVPGARGPVPLYSK